MFSVLAAARRTRFVLAAGAVFVAAACGEPPPAPAPAAPPVKTPEQRAQFYLACWNHFNDQAWDQFGACYTENAVSESVEGNPPSFTDRAEIIARNKLEAAGFPDRRGEVRLVLVNGGHVAGIALYTGTQTGPLPPGPDGKSIPATKKPIGLLVAHTAEFNPAGSHVVRDAAVLRGSHARGAARVEQSQGTARRETIRREPRHRDRQERRDRTERTRLPRGSLFEA